MMTGTRSEDRRRAEDVGREGRGEQRRQEEEEEGEGKVDEEEEELPEEEETLVAAGCGAGLYPDRPPDRQKRSAGACDSSSSSSAGSPRGASPGDADPRKRRIKDRKLGGSPGPNVPPFFDRRRQKLAPQRHGGKCVPAKKLQAKDRRGECFLRGGPARHGGRRGERPAAEGGGAVTRLPSADQEGDDAAPSAPAPRIAVATYLQPEAVNSAPVAADRGEEENRPAQPKSSPRPPSPQSQTNDALGASAGKPRPSTLPENDDASDLSDDKDDPMDATGGVANSPTVSSHSLNIDPQTSDDLRRLAMENTDTLEQLATKINTAAPGAATDRARSLFVTTWLMANYEVEEEHNVPRSSMYSHYLKYCQHHGVRPVNSASFGKLVRSVFPDLKTRRLGTRGQSKYHYCGIRIRSAGAEPDPPAAVLSSKRPSAAARPNVVTPSFPVSMKRPSNPHDLERQPASVPPAPPPLEHQQQEPNQRQQGQLRFPQYEHPHEHYRHYGYASLPEFPVFPEAGTPPGFRYMDVVSLLGFYRGYCQQLLDYVQTMRFAEVEGLIKQFWMELPQQQRHMLQSEHMIDYVYKADAILFDVSDGEPARDSNFPSFLVCRIKNALTRNPLKIVGQTIMGLLLPNVLQPMPLQVIQAIRTFARLLETWLLTALAGYPATLVEKKVEGENAGAGTPEPFGRVFSAQLRRHTSLNHLVQAAQSVFTSPEK
ncbi:MAG: RFX DNA-binding domain-containing protein, partial [Olpidium bornovanus]